MNFEEEVEHARVEKERHGAWGICWFVSLVENSITEGVWGLYI